MGGMKLTALPLPGLVRIDTTRVGDERGQFSRIFCEHELAVLRPGLHFTQVNLSETRYRGTARGLHYQVPPAAEAKLIRCLRGRVFDVAVDLRSGSPTFLQWHALELDAASETQVFIPEGFAHGFQALTDDVQLVYFHTASWQPALERRVHCDEPKIGVRWPLPLANLSARDSGAGPLEEAFAGVPV